VTRVVRLGLAHVRLQAQTLIVTITYSDGSILTATLLSHSQDEIRAIVPGGEDALEFRRVHGAWISEGLEPVTIGFEWQRCPAAPITPSVDECICSKGLAARLIQTLLAGNEPATADPLYVFTSEGDRELIGLSQLRPQ
jgi:hypothetical protein